MICWIEMLLLLFPPCFIIIITNLFCVNVEILIVPKKTNLLIFLFYKKFMFYSCGIQFFCFSNHSIIFKNFDITANISMLVWKHSWIYLLNYTLVPHETWPKTRYKQEWYFTKFFCMLWGTRSQIHNFLLYQPATINQKLIMINLWFFTLWRCILR